MRDISSRGFVNHAKPHESPLENEELIASEGDFVCYTRPKDSLDQKIVYLLLSSMLFALIIQVSPLLICYRPLVEFIKNEN